MMRWGAASRTAYVNSAAPLAIDHQCVEIKQVQQVDKTGFRPFQVERHIGLAAAQGAENSGIGLEAARTENADAARSAAGHIAGEPRRDLRQFAIAPGVLVDVKS